MQDDFWSGEGRRAWYEPEPESKMFLGNLFVELGKIRYGRSWPGIYGKPSAESAEPLKQQIAQAAASGKILTSVLNPKTFEYLPIGRAAWRNPKALSARFSRCRIDANDHINPLAEGPHHGTIYVERESANSFLDAVQTASPPPGNTVTLDHLSTYLRYMIFIAQRQKLDLDNPPMAKILRDDLSSGWASWRLEQCENSTLPPHAVISPRMLDQMVTIMRGEIARAAKGGGVKK